MYTSKDYLKIPIDIKNKLVSANLFFTENYENNVKIRGQKMFYVWNDDFVLEARVKKVLFLQAAVLESEPFCLRGATDYQFFLNQAMSAFKGMGVQWILTGNTARFQYYPKGAVVAPCGNHIIDLTLSDAVLWNNVHSKHRNSIRRGEKSGIEIKIGGTELVEQYTPLANETYRRSGGTESNSNYYRKLIDGLDNNACVFLAYKDNVLQSGAIFYYNEAIAYYLHGASIRKPEPGSTNYLLWEAVKYFKKKGIKEFSFVGYHYDPEPNSKLEGIQRFKERFGGVLEKSYNFRYECNPFAYKIFCVASQIKSGHPFKKYQDAIDKQVDKYPELNGGIK